MKTIASILFTASLFYARLLQSTQLAIITPSQRELHTQSSTALKVATNMTCPETLRMLKRSKKRNGISHKMSVIIQE